MYNIVSIPTTSRLNTIMNVFEFMTLIIPQFDLNVKLSTLITSNVPLIKLA
jgi:hypothetical protein